MSALAGAALRLRAIAKLKVRDDAAAYALLAVPVGATFAARRRHKLREIDR